jgi:hypothetical protein
MDKLMDVNKTKLFSKKSGGISLDIIWFLVMLAALLFIISLIPLPPNDFWWHLKIGQYIYTNHTIPETNMFSWSLPADQPFYYAAWLAELLFYILYRLGSLDLIIALRTFLIGATFYLAGSEAHRRTNSWRITALVVTLLGLISLDNILVRTQIWAWLPFVITYIILSRYTEGKISWIWLLLCPISMVFWVNVHGSYILGVILPGAFLVGEIITFLPKHQNAIGRQKIGWLGATVVASSLAILVNPRITGIINYTANLLTNKPSQQLIVEWQSPTPQGIANITFYVSILILILLIAYSKYRLKPAEITLVIGFMWLAWSGLRYVIWYGIVVTPILAQLISDLPIKMPSFVPQKNWLNLIIAIVLFTPVVLVQPWFVERMPLPATYWTQVQRSSIAGPLLDNSTPVNAAEYLKSHLGGKLFNEMGYGSYLIWAVPDEGVFIDPRVELYPYEQWMDYINIDNGFNYDRLLAKYGVDRILLDKKLQPKLATMLTKDKSWSLEYDDPYSQIWVKRTTQ